MTTIRVVTVDKGPPVADYPSLGDRKVELKPAEVAALVEAKIWESPEDRHGWTCADREGRVWAGAGETPDQLAQVRGKGGRRLGAGRIPGPDGARERVSYVLSKAARERLADLAVKRQKSMSLVLEELILDA